MLQIDNYSTLYSKKIQEAEWYKLSAARTTIKITATVAIVALIVIASISVHALSSPLSSIGTIGHNLVGSQGLLVVSAAGFTGSAVLSVLLIIYLRRSIFRLSDHVLEDKGFLYAIKDENQTIKGFLYGSIHIMPLHGNGLNHQVQEILNACRKVIVECHEIPEETGGISLTGMLGTQRGVDFKVMDHARTQQIVLDQFETLDKQVESATAFISVMIQEAMSRATFSNCCSRNQSSMSLDEITDRLLVTWQTGDEESALNILLSLTNGRGLDEMSLNFKGAFTNLIHTRNTNWMPKIQKELQQDSDQPIFIAVGSMHLFDFDAIDTTGLITQIRNAGYTVERVEDPVEDPE